MPKSREVRSAAPESMKRLSNYEEMVTNGTLLQYSQNLVMNTKDKSSTVMEIALFLRKRYEDTRDDKYKLLFDNVATHWELARKEPFPYSL
jgi:hypothetical protein